MVDKIIPRLKDIHYNVDEKSHSATLTEEGVDAVQRLLKIDNLYDPKNIIVLLTSIMHSRHAPYIAGM